MLTATLISTGTREGVQGGLDWGGGSAGNGHTALPHPNHGGACDRCGLGWPRCPPSPLLAHPTGPLLPPAHPQLPGGEHGGGAGLHHWRLIPALVRRSCRRPLWPCPPRPRTQVHPTPRAPPHPPATSLAGGSPCCGSCYRPPRTPWSGSQAWRWRPGWWWASSCRQSSSPWPSRPLTSMAEIPRVRV